MSDESVVFYSGTVNENVNDWGDNDDLQALMHAAADADARDNEEAVEALKEQEEPEEQPLPETTSHGENKRKHSTDHGENKRKHSTDHGEKRKHSTDHGEKRKHSTDHGENKRKCTSDQSTSKPKQLKIENKEVSSYESVSQAPRSGVKRTHEPEETPSKRLETEEGHANVVAAHYNTLEDKGLDERLKSRIFFMRNFNNWIKSMLINEYLKQVKEGMRHNSPIRVMDMCCGKGGDLLKWRKGNISYLICTDIASVSLEQCESRYKEMCSRSHRERNAGRVYKAEFIPADSTKVRLREKYSDPSIKLDLVSCQFAFHYSFESLPQAECMLRNAAECLQPGGYFIGTIPDANEIISRQRKADSNTFGNDVYQITFQCDTDLPPLFGAKYNFHLEGVVDCPEFLVHFPTFEKLARKFGLQLVKVERFCDFYEKMRAEGCSLLQKMQCLETYPPHEGTQLLGTNHEDYAHADEFVKQKNVKDQRIGTLSKSEWEAASLYLTFAFRKVKSTWDANGKPQYEFR